MYDNINKELVYVAESRSELAKVIEYHAGSLGRYFKSGELYLNQFIFSDKPLSESEYTINLRRSDNLLAYLNEIRITRKKEFGKNLVALDPLRKALCKQVKLTNIETLEVLVFESLTATVRYIKELDPKFAKVETGTLSNNIKKNFIYKGLFKVEYVESDDSKSL
jgi:hypothetical protein